MQHASLTQAEIGRDYERYVGYRYEDMGWWVNYRGILKGFRDKGRDLVCAKRGVVHIVQCKCWGKGREIGEEVVHALIETTARYRQRCHDAKQGVLDLPNVSRAKVIPALITSGRLSEKAIAVVRASAVRSRENFALKVYPSIKCLLSEKCYYLPTQVHYDNVKMNRTQGDRYIHSEHEAIALGYGKATSVEARRSTNEDSLEPTDLTESVPLFAGTRRVDPPDRFVLAKGLTTAFTTDDLPVFLTLDEIDQDLRELDEQLRSWNLGMNQ